MNIDHTTQTLFGYYMFVDGNNRLNEDAGNEARLVSIKNTDTSLKCLGFYYNMIDGDGMNKLSVILDVFSNSYPIWSKQIDTENKVYILKVNYTTLLYKSINS